MQSETKIMIIARGASNRLLGHPNSRGHQETCFPWALEELLQACERLPETGQSSTIQIRDEGTLGFDHRHPRQESKKDSERPSANRPSEG